MARLSRDGYEPVARSSLGEGEEIDLEDFKSTISYPHRRVSPVQSCLSTLVSATRGVRRRTRHWLPIAWNLRRPAPTIAWILLTLIVFTFLFVPSYTHLPPHYAALRKVVQESTTPGRGNPRNSTVFIAVSLYDKNGVLASGQWGQALLDLIDMLGPDNVFLSIYENDSDAAGERALRQLRDRVPCNKSVVYEDHFNFTGFPTVTLPDGSEHVRRVEFLAEVRNRALRPLDEHPELRFDRLLFLNDVYFHALDALQLLFSTNTQNGVSDYRAACAVDFINPFKFYDTFASRDLEGYSMGIPFYPWFTTAGKAQSRQDVLHGKDAVRVRSCWGGMVAFDAEFFQHPPPPSIISTSNTSNHTEYMDRPTPVRFRAETDLFWESSECCLIHADIQAPPPLPSSPEEERDTGIYMNPFIRVAYHPRSLSWLGVTRRFEKLYSLVHGITSRVAGLPVYNPRRTEVAGEEVQDQVWVADQSSPRGGGFSTAKRIANGDGFCGRWDMQVLSRRTENGGGGWKAIPVPSA
ncbi:glycosyltransferase family 69 protein [Aspergillus carbonarius ITEM 5010]|uniref:Glycosyltransferase family 69 protein n=1 Tax=Aspergillus carbonarius (strain ITEM 5010) TaxID=602072 RepID=A0A1R3S329_ASPC5|nr:glycosyltransferase family 69 protein [Aspergillus carbonarius ITEM 5010]